MSRLDAELEPELNAWLLKVMPDLDQQIEGASDAEIAAMEKIAGRPLPRFYRWFLARMGRHNGPFRARSLDYSVQRILSSYEQGIFTPHPQYLMIAFENDPIESEHYAYDFTYPARHDARVVRLAADNEDSDWITGEEAFREMFMHGAFLGAAILTKHQRVGGVITDDATSNVPALLDPVMSALGFTSPIETGPYFRVYEKDGAALMASAALDPEGPPCMAFHAGANSEGEIRGLLGQIVLQTGMELSLERWAPALQKRP